MIWRAAEGIRLNFFARGITGKTNRLLNKIEQIGFN